MTTAWQTGWFVDTAPRLLVAKSVGGSFGSGAAGKFYFEVTLNIAGRGTAIALGVCGASYPLLKSVQAEINQPQGAQGILWVGGSGSGNAFGSPTQPGGGGGFNHTPPAVIAVAVDTVNQLAWVRNVTNNGNWYGHDNTNIGDPAAGTFGATFSAGGQSPISGSIYVVCGASTVAGGTAVLPVAPPAPVLGSTAGGAIGATTYYVRLTHVAGGGYDGPCGPEASLAVGANNLLTVASPASVTNGIGYNVYVGTAADGETLQNNNPIAYGTGWTEPTSGLVALDTLPMPRGTINFGASAFTGAVPTGYVGWDVSGSTTLNPNDNSTLTLDSGNLRFTGQNNTFISGTNQPVNCVRSNTFKAHG